MTKPFAYLISYHIPRDCIIQQGVFDAALAHADVQVDYPHAETFCMRLIEAFEEWKRTSQYTKSWVLKNINPRTQNPVAKYRIYKGNVRTKNIIQVHLDTGKLTFRFDNMDLAPAILQAYEARENQMMNKRQVQSAMDIVLRRIFQSRKVDKFTHVLKRTPDVSKLHVLENVLQLENPNFRICVLNLYGGDREKNQVKSLIHG